MSDQFNPADADQHVVLVEFSIYGVPGFQTVAARGAGAKKRIRSAINEMDRRIKKIAEEGSLGAQVDSGIYAPFDADGKNPHINKAVHLLKLLQEHLRETTVGDQVPPADYVREVWSMSTAEFFATSERVYENNVPLLLQSLDALVEGHKKYLTARRAVAPAMDEKYGMVGLELYRCKGGAFGNHEFFFALTTTTMETEGQGYPGAAIQKIVYEHLRDLKNFRLSDYLRSEGEWREGHKREIERLDELMTLTGEISVLPVCKLSKRPHHHTPIDPNTMKAYREMEKESRERLRDHFAVREMFAKHTS